MVDKEAVLRGYDDIGERYAAERAHDDSDVEVLDRFLEKSAGLERVLDAGCGQGIPVLSELVEVSNAVGIDFSRGQLERAAANVPAAPLVRGDMTALPFGDETFDAAVAYWSLIHVPLDDHPTAIEEFARVLRPGGRLLLCEGTEAWSGSNPDWLDTEVEMQWDIAGIETTREQVAEAGFAIEEEWRTDDPLEEESGEETPWTFVSARLDAP